MKIKITKKSDNKNAWYNDRIGQEFELLTQHYTGRLVEIFVNFENGNRKGVVCFDNLMLVWNGDYEFVKEQDNERN